MGWSKLFRPLSLYFFLNLCTQCLVDCLLRYLCAVVVPFSRFPFPLCPFQVVQLHLGERCSAVGADREGFVMPGSSRWLAGCLSHSTTWLFTIFLITFSSSLLCDLLKHCFFFCRTAVGRVVCCSAFNSSCLMT